MKEIKVRILLKTETCARCGSRQFRKGVPVKKGVSSKKKNEANFGSNPPPQKKRVLTPGTVNVHCKSIARLVL